MYEDARGGWRQQKEPTSKMKGNRKRRAGLASAVVAKASSRNADINLNSDLDSCVSETCMQLYSSESLISGFHPLGEAVQMEGYRHKLTESLVQVDCLGQFGCALEEWGTRNDGLVIEDFAGASDWRVKDVLEGDVLNCYDRDPEIEIFYMDWPQIAAMDEQAVDDWWS